MTRQTKNTLFVVGAVAAAAAVYFWPKLKTFRPAILGGKPAVKKSGKVDPTWIAGTPENIALHQAMDAWAKLHPDTPFTPDA